jgi:hypothetical protein
MKTADTLTQYQKWQTHCRSLFERKTRDYGTAWRILRPMSLTDQIFIKAKRIRSIEEAGVQKVAEGILDEFVGIVNYGILALIQLGFSQSDTCAPMELALDETMRLYDTHFEQNKSLMLAKNHDYGEAWRDMRVSSLTDLILMKILRTKQIENNQGKTLVSEGIDANYRDMINYALFALIRLEEAGNSIQ